MRSDGGGRTAWQGFAGAAALVALATAVGALLGAHLSAPDITMLYVLVVVVAAALSGRGPALLASGLSVLAYNFFFVPPFHTLRVADERHLLTFGTMFVVGLLISALTSRIREQEREAREREKRTEELANAARSAELRANTEQIRSALLSAVSHDLRTPLGAITGAATTLRDSSAALGAGQRQELLETICEEAERLEHFVANLLEMTRLQSGALEVKREWVPLEEVVGSALARAEQHLPVHPVQTILPPELPLVNVDPVLMEQVFFNLLDNASKYAPGPVELSAGVVNGKLVIDVSDRGPGVEPGDEQRIFDKFYRSSRQSPGGAGLGLAICRGIVEAHGGRITAERREGGGTTFRMELPLGEAPSIPPELA